MEVLQEFDQRRYVPHQHLMQLPLQTRLVAKYTYIQWKIRHQQWDYESVEDDSS